MGVHKIPSQPIAGHGGAYLSSQTTWEAEIGRVMVSVQLGQEKLHGSPSQWKKAGYGSINTIVVKK
jgi:hypothetical protein